MKAVTAESLQSAWHTYRYLFGEDPHGTLPQLSVMLELVLDDDTFTVSLDTARMISNGFLPLNPNKLRQADPRVKAAAVEFKALLSSKLAAKHSREQP